MHAPGKGCPAAESLTSTSDSRPAGQMPDYKIPELEAGEDTGIRSDTEPPATGNERILFIDDEPALGYLAEKILGKLGYRVDTKRDSLDALDHFEKNNRVKGRDWYDLVWYISHHPELHLRHLEQRMRQTGDWNGTEELTGEAFFKALHAAIDSLDINKAREEVLPFLKDPDALSICPGISSMTSCPG